jgi:toxin-antitoxin system PIN domain toxin
MSWLLDGNVLVALAIDSHVHHERAWRWFEGVGESFATCATTEGTLLRVHMKMAAAGDAVSAWAALTAFYVMPDHEFWPEAPSYREVDAGRISGAAQVTDAWLAELARRKGAKLATMDEALAKLHADVVFLLPG